MACSSSCANRRPALSNASPLISWSAFGTPRRLAARAARSYRPRSASAKVDCRPVAGAGRRRMANASRFARRAPVTRSPASGRSARDRPRHGDVVLPPLAGVGLGPAGVEPRRSSDSRISSALAGRSDGFFARQRITGLLEPPGGIGRPLRMPGGTGLAWMCWISIPAGCRHRRGGARLGASRPRSPAHRCRPAGRSARRSPSRRHVGRRPRGHLRVGLDGVPMMDWSSSYFTSPKSSTFMKSYSRPRRQR